ncbi:Protocadherin Fat 4 [Desmophyllum pertusum]|uniref:Protocadherin Fat 4 n=1 Tax=Desmophyllum pertusum TaxID=174260 RepID=A0A9X0CXP7_9CNID|nr:Protocadherin Fat 4 [Desmophyllum pertusum]
MADKHELNMYGLFPRETGIEQQHASSVNLKTNDYSAERDCELNNVDASSHSQDLVPSESSSYYGTKNACSSNPCFAGATCQTGFTEKGYRCLCPAGSFGDHCEKAFGWIKINTEPVCFGAKKDTNGHFTFKIPGRIITMKLVHVSGKVNCVRGLAWSGFEALFLQHERHPK